MVTRSKSGTDYTDWIKIRDRCFVFISVLRFHCECSRMNTSAASPTYRAHWGLTEAPFRGAFDARFFYESPTHEEALARLQFLVEERQRLGLLLGETGTGKSMLLEVFARNLRRNGSQVANISLAGADLREFLWLIAAELGLNPSGRDDVFR